MLSRQAAVESRRRPGTEADPSTVTVGRALLNSEATTEAIRPFNPQGEFGARHWHTR